MKKTLKIFLTFVLVAGFIVASPKVINASSDIKVMLEGEELIFDVPPQIIEGRTLLPLRVIFENLGLEVGWDDKTRTITGTNEDTEIILKLDSVDATVNGAIQTLDVPAKATNGRTLVPVRFIAESLNMNVIWNQEDKAVKISKDDIVEWKYEGYEGSYPHREYERKYVNGNKTEETRYNGKQSLPIRVEVEVEEFNQDLISKIYAVNVSNQKYLGVDVIHFIYNTQTKQIEEEKKHEIGIPKKGETSYLGSYKRYVGSYGLLKEDGKLYLGTVLEGYQEYGRNSFENESFQDEKNKITSKKAINSAIEKYNNYKQKIAKELEEERALNNGIPLKITDKKITYNSIGVPEAHISFKNVSNKTIDALELTIKCYDSYGRVVKESISNRGAFYAISQSRNIIPGSQQGGTWTLNLFRNTTKVEVFVTSVHYTDGTVWKK